MRICYLLGLFVIHGVTLSSAAADDLSETAGSPHEVEVRENVEYGRAGAEPLLLDLALPVGKAGLRPAIVYLHGGSWHYGQKSVSAPRRAARRGFVAVSINYRLAPRHHWPAQIEDAKCAVRWLRAHADDFKIDPQRIGAEGHSAGAHLALLLGTLDEGLCEGTSGWPDESSRVQAVVSFAGPTNMIDEYRYSTNAKLLAGLTSRLPALRGSLKGLARSGNLVTGFMGGEPRGDLLAAYRLASPVFQVTADDPPLLLIQGTKDPIVPHFHATQMAEAMQQAGAPGRIEFNLGVGHAAGSERNHRAALEFFEEQLSVAPAAE